MMRLVDVEEERSVTSLMVEVRRNAIAIRRMSTGRVTWRKWRRRWCVRRTTYNLRLTLYMVYADVSVLGLLTPNYDDRDACAPHDIGSLHDDAIRR